jgi:hypothetical protein
VQKQPFKATPPGATDKHPFMFYGRSMLWKSTFCSQNINLAAFETASWLAELRFRLTENDQAEPESRAGELIL